MRVGGRWQVVILHSQQLGMTSLPGFETAARMEAAAAVVVLVPPYVFV